jgi:hypothetical protein
MRDAIDDLDVPLIYTPKFREVGIRVFDGGDSSILIRYCPWCGERLPESLRSQWVDELENLHIDPYGDAIPAQYLTDRWYSRKI